MVNIVKGTALSLTSALLIATFAAPVSAGFVDGAITFGGDFAPTGGTDLGDATGIDFLGNDFTVDATTGSFATINAGATGSINDFDFAPFTAVDPLWTIGGFSFELSSLTIMFQNATNLILSGGGTITGNGFDATGGTWSLSADAADTIFAFSSGTTAVPLPAAAWLFGSVVLGFVGLRRKQA